MGADNSKADRSQPRQPQRQQTTQQPQSTSYNLWYNVPRPQTTPQPHQTQRQQSTQQIQSTSYNTPQPQPTPQPHSTQRQQSIQQTQSTSYNAPQPQPTPQPHQTQRQQSTQQTQSTSYNAPQSQPTLERSRNPYNYTHQDLQNTTTMTLYPTLSNVTPDTPVYGLVSADAGQSQHGGSASGFNGKQEDFVVINPTPRERLYPQPSAPPEPAINSVREFEPKKSPSPPVASNIAGGYSVYASRPTVPEPSVNVYFNNNTSSAPRGKVTDDPFRCPTCSERLGLTIFQCTEGHSSCQQCRLALRRCGKCSAAIIDMRNIALEAHLAEISTVCPSEGCTLSFKVMEMDKHLKECPFGEMDCPMGTNFGRCSLRFKVDAMASHFDACHPNERIAEVGKEMFLFINRETWRIFLIKNGPYNFIVHVKVQDMDGGIYMAVQLLGTEISAMKWIYEVHVYNKRQPRRKFQYTGNCLSVSTPAADIFNDLNCAILPLNYARSFSNDNNGFTYKFYIKKIENRPKKRYGRNRVNTGDSGASK